MNKAPTVRELADAYLATRRVGHTQTRVVQQLVQTIGTRRPDALTPAWVQAYTKARGCADATRRRELGALRTVLSWAERTQLIDRARHIDLPPPGQPRELFMDETQARDFHDAALSWSRFDGRVALFVSLALNTAARREAIQKLRWDRVDMLGETVDYREPGARVSKKRRVPVPMNSRLKGVLQWGLQNPVDGSPFVIGECSIRHPYECFVQEINMGWVTPHVLRHTAATLMLRAGHTLWEVAGVLGDSPVTVARVYGHHSTTHLRSAVGALC